MTDLPEGWEPRWSNEQDAEIRRIVGEILRERSNGTIDLTKESDPLIDQPMIAALAGVQNATVYQWLTRSKAGLLLPAFPEPDDSRYVDKPQWRAISTVVNWLWPRRWPPGASGRPESRGPKQAGKAKGITIRDGHAYSPEGDDLGEIVGKAA